MKNIFSILVLSILMAGCSATNQHLPGRIGRDLTLLPNGWMLSPAGTSIALGDLPLGMAISHDGKYAAIVNNGQSKHSISLVDIDNERVIQTLPIKKSWYGVEFAKQSNSLYISTGYDNSIAVYEMAGDTLIPNGSIQLGDASPSANIIPAGITIDKNDKFLYAVTRGDNTIYQIDIKERRVCRKMTIGDALYACQLDADERVLFVTVWGAGEIVCVSADSLKVLNRIRVGDHPTEMVQSLTGDRLFIANANMNTVSVVDCMERKVIETISTAIMPNIPNGSTPNSVSISPDGLLLYVANADNNYLAVIDITKKGYSRPAGFIPTGWYPTVVRCLEKKLLVVNGKGMSSAANPKREYIAGLFQGTLSFIPTPSQEDTRLYTARVYQNTPLTRDAKMNPWDDSNPIPKNQSLKSPIKHVFYIVKENRTYDQVFGDIPTGNGDSSLCLFGREVTPNHHALAEEFVLLDNFYVDAEVSADGHNWSMAAYATDYVEKTWPTFYGGRGGRYDFEEEGIATPTNGYIWDNCLRNGISFRNYGEFLDEEASSRGELKVNAKGLAANTAPKFRGWDLSYPDMKRADAWIEEFDAYEMGDTLPQFQIIRIPNDHTAGTKKGISSPRAMVADNDLALGRIVDRISHSRYWFSSAIFVLEDDAQNGPDHVDAHRSIALVISPYTKRHFVDHTMYSTSGMIHTMERILGLPPMSQYDASATPMYYSFNPGADLRPYTKVSNQIDLNEKNALGAYGQDRVAFFDLSKEDAIPDVEFNEIIWRSIKGTDMPSPVRSAFLTMTDR
jgi:DNA-binding beta-propeller fold protein YncE